MPGHFQVGQNFSVSDGREAAEEACRSFFALVALPAPSRDR
jgi:hypothetical protein